MKFIVTRPVHSGGTATAAGAAISAGQTGRICFVLSVSGDAELFLAAAPGTAGTGIAVGAGAPFQFEVMYYGPISLRGVSGSVTYSLMEGCL